RDSIRVNSVIDGKDTVVRVGPQLRIPLNKEKVTELLDGNIDSAVFNEHDFYHNRVKGFQVSVNKEAQSGVGGIVHLAISDNSQNGLIVYYKTPDTSLQKNKFYLISPSNAAASVNHVYSTEVQNQLDNPGNNYETVYARGVGGLRIKLSLPTIASSSLQNQDLIINKAELVVLADEETTGSAFNKQAPRLTLYREDIAGQRTP